MFNTNSQVIVVSYMYCYITIRLNLIYLAATVSGRLVPEICPK